MYKDIGSLRILHIGNIAGNAYNIAKALREKAGIEADVFADHDRYFIYQPEWEDADIDEYIECESTKPIDWTSINLHGFKRPDWYFEEKNDAILRISQLSAKKNLLRIYDLEQHVPTSKEQLTHWHGLIKEYPNRTHEIAAKLSPLAKGQLPDPDNSFYSSADWHHYLYKYFEANCVPPHSPLQNTVFDRENQQWLTDLLQQYDIIQTYGLWQLLYPILYAPSIPRVTLEHGTMREFPFQNNDSGRKSMLAYKTAFANIITNADAIHNARRMGLTNYSFIPHPVDDTKFCPKPDPVFREKLLRQYDASHLFFAPARQNWEIKGNDRILKAFARFIRTVGHGPKLLLGAWGQEVARSRQLIQELRLEEHTAWIPPLPKRMLARYINACDAVLDQFILGAFGTTTPEAMACGKPVLLYYNADDHRWCLPEDPPVINVQSTEEIATALRKLYDNPAYAENLGQQGLAWFREHHSLDVVVQRHLDIYKAIFHAPHCIQVPYEVLFEGSKMKEQHVTCVVDCRQASSADEQRWLVGIKGQSALEILDGRLRGMHNNVCCVLALAADMPAMEQEARRLGWLVYRPLHPLSRIFFQKGVLSLLMTDFVYICHLDQPFLLKEQIADWKITDKKRIVAGESHNTNPYVPQKIYSRSFVIYRYLLQKIFKKHFTKLQCQSIMLRYGSKMPVPSLDDKILKLRLDNIMALAPHLSPKNFSYEDIKKLPSAYDVLEEKMKESDRPYAVNTELNTLEQKLRLEYVRSFPTYVGLNLISRCNARCVFCSIQPDQQKVKDAFSLEEIKQMDWLRYASRCSVWGGIGDSLVNKDFLPIVRYLHETYPHLHLELSTNGIGLNEEICQTLAEALTVFNISLNAARATTWEKLMRAKGFERVCANFSYLASLRCRKKTLRMTLSMVLTRDNISESIDFVDLAHSLGADRVIFTHYVPTTLVGKRDMPADQSCYLDRNRSDDMLGKAMVRAEELGLEYVGPTLFHKQSEYIHFGARALTPPPACHDPWRTCYLTVDEDGNRQMIFCCSGFYYAIAYDKGKLDEASFRRLWNHPTARFFRHTVNRPGENPICTYCTSVDRFNPENRELYNINEKIQPYFSEIERRYKSGEDVDVGEIANYIKRILA